LYTALILDDLGIPYKILEAQKEVGGRLKTHQFRHQSGQGFDYYDVGAMRFPQIPAMKRVFHLFEYPHFNKEDSKDKLSARLVPYIFATDDALMDFNGEKCTRKEAKDAQTQGKDIFLSTKVIADTNSSPYVKVGTDEITKDVIYHFALGIYNDIRNNTKTGWKMLNQFDSHSTRSYMTNVYRPSPKLNLPDKPLPTDVVNWCETFDKSSGWYDRSLSETVLEAIAFGWQPDPPPGQKPIPTDWKCLKYALLSCAYFLY